MVHCEVDASANIVDPEDHLIAICNALLSLASEMGVPAETRLELRADTLQPNLFRGHLRWHEGETVRESPLMDFGVVDSEIRPGQYEFIASGLLDATYHPGNATNGD